MQHTPLSISDIIARHPDGIVIRPYQRRYLWGDTDRGDRDPAANLTDCLVKAYSDDTDYYLQCLTFDGDSLIDGQQRLTYLLVLTRMLGYTGMFAIRYEGRPGAQACVEALPYVADTAGDDDPDVYHIRGTAAIIARRLSSLGIDTESFLSYVMHRVKMLCIELPKQADAVAIYTMMNSTKAPMYVPDIIKAEMMRLASDASQPSVSIRQIDELRGRYANEWDSWVRWWNSEATRRYWGIAPGEHALELLLKLCLRRADDDCGLPLEFDEFSRQILSRETQPFHAAKHIFSHIRRTHKRFEQAMADTGAYNRIRAILLLQTPAQGYRFMHMYFVEATLDTAALDRYYRLSFLGMSVDDILAGEPVAERFDNLLAALSQADVYHSDAKRDVFNLLLRLNIDEDIKLGRRFDFDVWDNRSLEHIYSKSKVWHTDASGRILDGNDNQLRVTRGQLSADATYMPRNSIVNHDGTELSEHCIGNLVLLYGQNNADFGNATFESKKMMFLSPGDQSVFRSRNLLHSVCVFARNSWDHRSIVDNYNLTLKNLKIYYGFK